MPRRALLALFVLLGAACDSNGDTAGESEHAETANGRVGGHGMVLVGDPNKAFISHVPLFANPHDVQVIAAGSIVSTDGSPAPTSFSDQLFTFLPNEFSLDALRTGTLRSLDGKVFTGSFEHGGRPVAGKFRFSVQKIIHQHVLDPQAPQSSLTYIVFGSRERAFAAHKIAGPPSFDEVVGVELGGNAPTNDQLANGVEMQIPNAPDAADARGALESAPPAALSAAAASPSPFSVKRKSSLSCLAGPDFFDGCK